MKICIEDNCETRASFGLMNGKQEYCAKHKKENMIDLMHKLCKADKCTTRPTYGTEGKTAEYCLKHKKENMINVVSDKCKEDKCITRPYFGLEGGKPEYCLKHKKENMIDLINKKCKNCDLRANFGIEGGKAEYCLQHKKENMIDLTHNICKEDKCVIRSSFGLKGGKAEYCSNHKKENMIDVVSKKCKENNCDIISCFGLEGREPEYCSQHKKEGMINVVSNICKEDKCNTRPSFGIHGQSAEYCLKHKKENMINVTSKNICLTCPTLSSNPLYKGYCLRCFVHHFPNEPVTRNYKVKENYVFDAVLLKLKDHDINITRDKKIDGGCSARRPDLLIDLGSHWICVENDENQHKDYDNSCENKRTMLLYSDMALRPMILIRFNCDKYDNQEGLFKICKQSGLSLIKNKKEFEKRINILVECIIKHINEVPEKAITTEYLFYSEFLFNRS